MAARRFLRPRRCWTRRLDARRRSSAAAQEAPESSGGYKSFGSFHSEDVEVLIRQGEDEYERPEIPFDTTVFTEWATAAPSLEFGKPCKEHFFVDPSWVFLNHGAFGGSLRMITEYGNRWREYCEAQPLRFYDRVLLPHLVYSHRALSAFVRSSPTDLVLVPNATTALNSIVRSTIRDERDRVVMLDIGYGAVKKIAETVCRERHAKFDLVTIPFPLEGDFESTLFERVKHALDKQRARGRTLVIFDHTTSNTGLNLPVASLATLIKSFEGTYVAVDGAHGLLAQPLDMHALERSGVDFYAGTCHKWLCSQKGVGFLWSKNAGKGLAPCVISHGFGQGFLSSYMWDGCRDYSSALALPLLLQFWNERCGGGDRVRSYQQETLQEGVKSLISAWQLNPSPFLATPFSIFHAPMALVPMPEQYQRGAGTSSWGNATSADAKIVQDALHERHMIEVPVKNVAGRLHIRVSAHIYNDRQDFEALGAAVVSMADLLQR